LEQQCKLAASSDTQHNLQLTASDNSAQLVGKRLDFKFTDVDGQIKDSSLLKGNVLVLVFWATWCAPCRAEMPMLQQYVKDTSAKKLPVQLIGISVDNDHEALSKFLRQHPSNYSIVELSRQAASPFGLINGFPHELIITEQGVVAENIVGGLTKQDLQNRVGKYLDQPSVQ